MMRFWNEFKKKKQVEEGIVGNWDIITKFILACSPYEIISKIKKYYDEKKHQENPFLEILEIC